jgi:hypothetical protein
MKQMAALTQDLTAGKISPDLIKDLQGFLSFYRLFLLLFYE